MGNEKSPKNGLELVERIVDVDGDACESPHGFGSCVVLGFAHLPRYTGAIIFQALVEG
jgi:acetyl-CoA carboxylase carboxyltransferase component